MISGKTRSAGIVARRGAWALVVLLAVTSGCGILGGSRLSNSYATPDALARAVVTGLERKDRAFLEELLVTREEHEKLLWNELPESKDLPFEYARSLNMRNTRKALDHLFSRFGGGEFEFLRLEFTAKPEAYPDFTLHFGPRLWVKRVSNGEEGYLPILDVVLEYHGRWKPMNYAD